MDREDDKDWCSINEAARRLKVTPTAIRNRIKRRTLETKPNGNHGRLVRVPLPVPLMVPVTVTDTGSDTVALTVTDTVRLTVPPTVSDPVIPELRTQIAALETRLKATQDELLAMAQKVGATESEVIALQAQAAELRADRDAWRRQAETLALTDQTKPGALGTAPSVALEPRRPWWRRLAG